MILKPLYCSNMWMHVMDGGHKSMSRKTSIRESRGWRLKSPRSRKCYSQKIKGEASRVQYNEYCHLKNHLDTSNDGRMNERIHK